MPPDNLLDAPLALSPAPAAGGPEEAPFEIDTAAKALPAGARPEPVLAAPAGLPEAGEAARLDPHRAIPQRDRPPASRPRGQIWGVLGSLCLHLLPLLLLLEWTGTPPEIAAPIPVQLVIEAPPPPSSPPPPKPEEFKRPPPGPLASTEIGNPASEPDHPAAEANQPADELPPKPTAPPAPEAPAPKPTPRAEAFPLPIAPKPTPPPRPPSKQAIAAVLPNLHPAIRSAQIPGPAASRDEYLAYCMALIRRYYDMLPLSFIAGRHGTTVLSLVVLDDGTIGRISLRQSSGYRDIDSRIEQMIAAVGHFPPLPQWTQAPSITVEYLQTFPEGLTER